MISPVLLIAIPLLLSFIPAINKKFEKPSLILVMLLNIVALFLMDMGVYNIGGWKPPFGISLVLDNYSFLGIVIVNVAFAVSVMISFESLGKYSTTVLIALAGLNGMVLTGDLFNLFVFMEISAIAAYILSSVSKKYRYTFNYLILGTFGSGLYLLGTIILYGIFGSLNMVDISEKITTYAVNPAVMFLPLVLIFVGLAVEAKLIPFNGWVKGVFGNANGLVGSIFSTGYAAAIILVFGRLFSNVFVTSGKLEMLFAVIAILTFIMGEFAAFSKNSLRDILLFSSIAQSGLIITLLVFGLVYPALLQLLNNVVAKLIMFSIAGILAIEAGSDNIEDLRGIFKKYKLIGFGFSVAALSIVGLPLFYGFYTKINILMALINSGNLWLPALILIVSVIEGAYFIRLLAKLWNPGEEGIEASSEYTTERFIKHTAKVKVVVALIGVLIITAGILPGIVGDKVKASANVMQDDIPSFYWDMSGGMDK